MTFERFLLILWPLASAALILTILDAKFHDERLGTVANFLYAFVFAAIVAVGFPVLILHALGVL